MDEPQILVTRVPDRTFDMGAAVRSAAAARGISRSRLTAELLRRQFGRQRLSPKEYFLHGVHRAGLTDDERGRFIGDDLGFEMCRVLGAAGDRSISGVFLDKVLCDLVLRSTGLKTPRIQALAGPPRGGLPYPMLPDPAAVARFLDHEAELPVFGKPFAGSMSLGAISILGRPAAGRLMLGDGREVATDALVGEIFRHYRKGYLFQDMLLPHPLAVPMLGPVLATTRIVTLRVAGRHHVLYGGIKWPGKGAMVDGPASISSIEASVEVETGRVIRIQDPRRLGGTTLAENPVTSVSLAGQAVPDWQAAMELALAAHATFPDQPILGGDIGLTPEGPVIVELNTRPGMSFYQKTTASGLWNHRIAPLLTEALAEAGHRRPTRAMPLPWTPPGSPGHAAGAALPDRPRDIGGVRPSGG